MKKLKKWQLGSVVRSDTPNLYDSSCRLVDLREHKYFNISSAFPLYSAIVPPPLYLACTV